MSAGKRPISQATEYAIQAVEARVRGDGEDCRRCEEALVVALLPPLTQGASSKKYRLIGRKLESVYDSSDDDDFPISPDVLALVDEAMIVILGKLEKFDPEKSDVENWAMRVARNRWIDIARNLKSEKRTPLGGEVSLDDEANEGQVDGWLISQDDGIARIDILSQIRTEGHVSDLSDEMKEEFESWLNVNGFSLDE